MAKLDRNRGRGAATRGKANAAAGSPPKRTSRAATAQTSPRLVVAGILIITFLLYAQSLGFDFVNWDDDKHIFENPWLQHIGHFWRYPYESLYVPVAYTFWALVASLAKTTVPAQVVTNTAGGVLLNPAVFHAATLLLHCANAVMVFALLRRVLARDQDQRTLLTSPFGVVTVSDAACGLGALLFAVHPLQVESVAWISETRGTLGTALGLCGLLLYLKVYDSPPAKTLLGWLLATLAFGLAVLAKPTIIVLPLVAVIIDTLVFKRSVIKGLPIYVIWSAIAIAAVLKTQSAQVVTADLKSQQAHGIVVAADAIGFYIAKLLVPIKLCCNYGRTPMWLMCQHWAYITLATLAFVIGLIAWTWRRFPVIAAGALIFVVALLPVLGLVPFAYQENSTVADRYMYVAMIGPSLCLAWMLLNLGQRQRSAFGYAAAVLALFAIGTFFQSQSWANSTSLFTQAIAVNPGNPGAYDNLGFLKDHAGDYAGAADDYRKALKFRPNSWAANANLASALVHMDKTDEALPHLTEAIRLNPGALRPRIELATILLHQRRYLDARTQCEFVLQQEPRNPEALFVMSGVYGYTAANDQTTGNTQAMAADNAKGMEYMREAAYAGNTQAQAMLQHINSEH